MSKTYTTYVATMEVGSAIMNTIFLSRPEVVDESGTWMVVDYLYRVITEDDGSIGFDPIPNNGAPKSIRMSRHKIVGMAEASPNIASHFLDVIGTREKTPSDIVEASYDTGEMN